MIYMDRPGCSTHDTIRVVSSLGIMLKLYYYYDTTPPNLRPEWNCYIHTYILLHKPTYLYIHTIKKIVRYYIDYHCLPNDSNQPNSCTIPQTSLPRPFLKN